MMQSIVLSVCVCLAQKAQVAEMAPEEGSVVMVKVTGLKIISWKTDKKGFFSVQVLTIYE